MQNSYTDPECESTSNTFNLFANCIYSFSFLRDDVNRLL